MNADALPDLGNAGIVRMPPSSDARVWVNVITGDLAAGSYTTTMHMRALTPTGSVWSIPVRWTVVPISLPEVMPLRFCNWGYGYASQFSHAPDAALRDQQDHHTSVFVCGLPPVARYDDSGGLSAEPEWTELDAFLGKLRPQDMVLFGGYAQYPVAQAEGAPAPFAEPWRTALAAFLPRWTRHLAERGFGYERWVFYPVDEARHPERRTHRHPGAIRAGRQGHRPAGADLHGTYRGMTVADHKRLVDVLDIVQPTLYFVVLLGEHRPHRFPADDQPDALDLRGAGARQG